MTTHLEKENSSFKADEANEDNLEAVHDENAAAAAADADAPAAASEADQVDPATRETSGRAQAPRSAKGRVASFKEK